MPQVEEPVNERMEAETLIKKSLDGNIGTITLDNPSKHNALSAALIGELLRALADLTNGGARAIVLRATRGRRSGPLGTMSGNCRPMVAIH